MSTNTKKIVKVRFKAPNGEWKAMNFQAIGASARISEGYSNSTPVSAACSFCPYSCGRTQESPLGSGAKIRVPNYCDRIQDPRYKVGTGHGFLDFCSTLFDLPFMSEAEKPGNIEFEDPTLNNLPETSENKELVGSLIPMPGELERIFHELGEQGIVEQLTGGDMLIPMNLILEHYCKTTCEYYSEDRTNCHASNSFCIFKDLLFANKAYCGRDKVKPIEREED